MSMFIITRLQKLLVALEERKMWEYGRGGGCTCFESWMTRDNLPCCVTNTPFYMISQTGPRSGQDNTHFTFSLPAPPPSHYHTPACVPSMRPFGNLCHNMLPFDILDISSPVPSPDSVHSDVSIPLWDHDGPVPYIQSFALYLKPFQRFSERTVLSHRQE